MSHQETYRHNETYAEFLANESPHFHAKYADSLRTTQPGARILDVGCGVGQVIGHLTKLGYEAHGVRRVGTKYRTGAKDQQPLSSV